MIDALTTQRLTAPTRHFLSAQMCHAQVKALTTVTGVCAKISLMQGKEKRMLVHIKTSTSVHNELFNALHTLYCNTHTVVKAEWHNGARHG